MFSHHYKKNVYPKGCVENLEADFEEKNKLEIEIEVEAESKAEIETEVKALLTLRDWLKLCGLKLR